MYLEVLNKYSLSIDLQSYRLLFVLVVHVLSKSDADHW